MALSTVPQFLDALRDLGVLSDAQWHALAPKLADPAVDLRTLGREFITQGWLTPFQINRLVQGRSKELVLGHYVLMEQLGEGGMGTVYKARHRILNRVAALKLIRKEMLGDADAVRRFRREMEAVARLQHVNVVLAYDADEVQGTHFFAMEYVDGVNLTTMVKKQGPLAVASACEFIRQAALGLQHAHDHGLVHRDIKPSNLLYSAKDNNVKVLDLGLARLHQEDGSVSALTQTGSVMGTPDFMAPEQATNPHGVDVRADIYSLGATLYFLLTGKPPFPGGTLEQKISWHLHAQPPILEKARPDVPAGLSGVLLRMLAKNPADRYGSPSEVALALAGFCAGAGGRIEQTVSMPGLLAPALPDSPTANPNATLAPAVRQEPKDLAPAPAASVAWSPSPPRRTVPVWLYIGGGVAVVLLLAVLLIAFLPGPDLSDGQAKSINPLLSDKDKTKDDKDGVDKNAKGSKEKDKQPLSAMLVDGKQRIFFHFGPEKQVGFWAMEEAKRKVPLTFDFWGTNPDRSTTNTVGLIGNRIVEFGHKRDGKWEQDEARLGAGSGGQDRLGRMSVWQCDKIRFTQTVEVVPSRNTLTGNNKPHHLLDTCLVLYRLENLDARPHKLGLRCYLDTMIADNDRPYFATGRDGIFQDPHDFATPDKVPAVVRVMEWKDVFQPVRLAYFTAKVGGKVEAPSRLCALCAASDRVWDVPLRTKEESAKLRDAALVIYWDTRDIGPGASRLVGFAYGLGVPVELDPALEPEVQAALAAPRKE